MPNVHKMVKHTFIILQQILQNLSHVFDHFVDTMDYRVNQFKHIPNDFV